MGMAGAARFACAAWERVPVQTGNRAVGSRGGSWEGKLRQGARTCRVHAGREVSTRGGWHWGNPWQHTRSHTPRGGVADPESLLHCRVQAEGSPNPTTSRSSTGPTSPHRVRNILSPGPRLSPLCFYSFLATSGVRPKAGVGGIGRCCVHWFAIQGQRKNRDRRFIKAEEWGNRLSNKASVCTAEITSPGSDIPEQKSPKEGNSRSSCQRPGLS